MGVAYKLPRGTRSALNTLRSGNSLVVGQIYLLTDENRMVFATAVNAYVEVPKVAELDNPVVITGNYTLDVNDLGRMHRINSASAVTITLPNSFTAGWFCHFRQVGAGKAIFSAQAGGSKNCIDSAHDRTAGQWAEVSLGVDSNTGTNAAWVLSGATGT